ncbi:MAG: alpha/beta hydrolase [Deltaproteobacteria bacterium]|nr:alpha/beta hydrolase [Deltaproteobacteria bacterium]MBV8454086.1 alpha/beta hydrolase [Deltaproteobacteria bacterium]
MDLVLAGLHAQLERPQTRKFAWPIVVLPELFTTSRHLTIMAGHLVSLGWEVYLLDVHPPITHALAKNDSANAFCALAADIEAAIGAIGSEIIAAGHGLGGSLALKVAEAPPVRAAVALAPLIPGFHSPLFVHNRHWAFWRSKSTGLPARRKMLELISEAEPFQRESIIKALTPADTSAAMAIASGAIEFAALPTPRLIVVGEADAFAPWQEAEQLAIKIGARFVSLPGRGHWIIAGRTLGRTIAQIQRFLVKALGEELLLFYAEPDGIDPAL